MIFFSSSEVNSGFFYKSADEREKLVKAERAFTDSKVQKIIDFKKQVCDTGDKGDGKKKGFVCINMKVNTPTMSELERAVLSTLGLYQLPAS